jgi:hypothetical protein
MFAKDSGLLQGTLELLVLKTLSWGPTHGYGIAFGANSQRLTTANPYSAGLLNNQSGARGR